MSDDLVKRYQLDYHHTRTYAEMAEDCDGDWVKYNDYKDAADRIEELEANINIKADFIDATINQLAASDQRIEELEAKLAKVTEELEEYKWMYEDLCK